MEKKNYGASNIKVLKGLEAVRKRPGMYIGDTNINGLHHLIYEVVDNSIDESMAGHCDKISVEITTEGSVIISDNGRGIPVDIHPTENISAATVVLTVLHAGGKFDKDTYKVSGGLHGVGVSVVNALSKKLILKIDRDKKRYFQEFEMGIPKAPLEEIGVSKKTGTTIEFWPDDTIFETVEFQYDILAKRFKELAYLNPKITITFKDNRVGKEETFHFEGGIRQFVEDLNKQDAITKSIEVSEKIEDIEVDLALMYNTSYHETFYSFVNNIKTIEGGTHESGFRAGLTRAIVKYINSNANQREKDVKVTGDDVREGLIAIVSVRVPEPQFEGQTKSKLGSSYVKPLVQKLTNEKLSKYFE
ncbi:MAG TPA: DNA gyrase subunit B, partial [Bacteroidetes bacterium]|nr:DNA gyrase subunit B [Bacteroidota bacterium]